jgi:protocatechuate 3,4-dioxygenase beta subunit
MILSRRHLIAAVASAVAVRGRRAGAAEICAQSLPPTQYIDGPPEYIHGAPMRTSFLKSGARGRRIRLIGRALTTRCQPLARARLDFWHTDAAGVYDMTGFKFRGVQLTDAQGRFHLDTIMPGPYGNPRHVHFLLATRVGGRPQPSMLSAAIFFPTAEEFAKAPADEHAAAEFLNPATLRTVDGVLIAPCDIVLEVA